MSNLTPAQCCTGAGLDSLREVCDLTGIKSRVLFKWFHTRKAVFDAVVADAAYLKAPVSKDKQTPSEMCSDLGLGDLQSVSVRISVALTDLYRWSAENPDFLYIILVGAKSVTSEKVA